MQRVVMTRPTARTAPSIKQFLSYDTCGRIMLDCLKYAAKHEIHLSQEDVDKLHGLLKFTEIGLLEQMGDYEVSLMVRSYNAGKNTRKP